MAILKKRWTAAFSVECENGKVVFVGREPFTVPDKALRDRLMRDGVYQDNGDGTMTYTGQAHYPCKTCKQSHSVSPSGTIEMDDSCLECAAFLARETSIV